MPKGKFYERETLTLNTKQFGDFLPEYTDPATAAISILPVPYDGTSTWVKGANKGPEAILKASYNLEFYDIETDSEVFRQGIFTEPPVEGFKQSEQMVQVVRQRMSTQPGCGTETNSVR